jgi:uncharacterized protein (TIGR00730 family)
VDANGRGPLPSSDGNGADQRPVIADLVRRLRNAADQLPIDRTAHEDLKILSQTLRELRRAFSIFAPYRSQRKVTVFGSARTPHDAPSYKQAIQLGKRMADSGWFVVTGAATGIMEAGHRGAGRERSMGINIMLPFEQQANEIIRGDGKLVTMKYFFTRKLMFVMECDAVVCLPGGFGTLDEALEVLTLLQTGKRDIVPVVFLDEPEGDFWKAWNEFAGTRLLADGMISRADQSLYKICDSVDETVAEVLQFYRVFHSMRFVRKQLVFRLQRPLSDAAVADLNESFGDVLADGEFVQRAAFKEETDESQLVDLPRLAFHFNRRNYGRLLELIDAINSSPPGEIKPSGAT